MGEAEKKAGKRLLRNLFSLVLSSVVAYTTGKPYLLVLAPIINAGAKWLRDKFGLKYSPL